jgi:hypothetical protein
MPRVYRVMTVDNDKPLIADSARGLGVRVDGSNSDILADDRGQVSPVNGGMSVAPHWRDLPEARIPVRLREKGILFARGKNHDACWRFGEGDFLLARIADGLQLRPDRPDHGLVEPDQPMSLEHFRAHLAATRDGWKIDEE